MGRSNHSHSRNHIIRQPRSYVVAAVALLLLAGYGLHATRKDDAGKAVDQQKRILHALDRLTFGPRPGDAQIVAAMGFDKWIDLQLHPEKVDNSALQARLASYRTLAMSSREMLLEFPPNPVIKAVMDGKLPMPQDPYRRAIYLAAMNRVGQQQQQKQKAAETNATATDVAASPASTANPPPAMQTAGLAQRQATRRLCEWNGRAP